MNVKRTDHTASVLADGKVLGSGGFNDKNRYLSISSVEVHDPSKQI
jgi:hypothetical protein